VTSAAGYEEEGALEVAAPEATISAPARRAEAMTDVDRLWLQCTVVTMVRKLLL
jgi:hypothetical protein